MLICLLILGPFVIFGLPILLLVVGVPSGLLLIIGIPIVVPILACMCISWRKKVKRSKAANMGAPVGYATVQQQQQTLDKESTILLAPQDRVMFARL
jgi:hypothetical protein